MTEQEKQVLAGLCRIEIKRWKAAADSNPNMRYMVELMDVALASLAAESGWIKCSDRMPKPATGVLVAAPWESAPGGYAIKWATNCHGHPDADGEGWIIPGASWNPTHWQTLPAPPEE